MVALAPASLGGKLSPALLGHYDLSGQLFRYDQVPGLKAALAPIGFAEWRVGVGRWEAATQLLPALTDGTLCPAVPLPAAAFAQKGTTDLQLIAARDWFTDDGQPVTEAMTLDDNRYALGYVRSAIDVATALGASPYMDIDHMPRALAVNRTPSRTLAALPEACNWTWTNRVSNVAPVDKVVFAAAVAGMVKRVVEGSGGAAPRPAVYWEFWNEPELSYAWDPLYDDPMHTQFFQTAIGVLVRLDAYRKTATAPAAKALRFGLGSFANAATAAAVITALDQAGGTVPLDFVSFHSYGDKIHDPLRLVADIAKVTAARRASVHYRNIELVLSEWGPSLGDPIDPAGMDAPLMMSTVIALGATDGLDRAHHTFFYDFYPQLVWGLLSNDVQPTPLYRAYQLLAATLAGGSDRLVIAGHEDGRLDGGMGAVLASRDASGALRVLLINRGATPRTARVDVSGATVVVRKVSILDDPKQIRVVPAATVVTVPPRSLVALEL